MITDKNTPPEVPSYGSYWERSKDPFHVDALPKDINLENIVFVGAKLTKENPRKEGWMLIDWCENPIGFIPDGTLIKEHGQKFDYKINQYGKMSAYPRKKETTNDQR